LTIHPFADEQIVSQDFIHHDASPPAPRAQRMLKI
jgi:hypothetical protein